MSKVAKNLYFGPILWWNIHKPLAVFCVFLSQLNYFFHFELISIFEKLQKNYAKMLKK